MEGILEQLNARSPLMDFMGKMKLKRIDWGFDDVWPRAQDQEWFSEWEEKVRA